MGHIQHLLFISQIAFAQNVANKFVGCNESKEEFKNTINPNYTLD